MFLQRYNIFFVSTYGLAMRKGGFSTPKIGAKRENLTWFLREKLARRVKGLTWFLREKLPRSLRTIAVKKKRGKPGCLPIV